MRIRGGIAALLPFAASLALAAPVNDACNSATVVPDEAVNRYFDTLDPPTATINGIRAKVLAASAAGDNARRLAKLRRAADRRADSLLGMLTRSATRQKIPASAAPAILDAAARLATAIA